MAPRVSSHRRKEGKTEQLFDVIAQIGVPRNPLRRGRRVGQNPSDASPHEDPADREGAIAAPRRHSTDPKMEYSRKRRRTRSVSHANWRQPPRILSGRPYPIVMSEDQSSSEIGIDDAFSSLCRTPLSIKNPSGRQQMPAAVCTNVGFPRTTICRVQLTL